MISRTLPRMYPILLLFPEQCLCLRKHACFGVMTCHLKLRFILANINTSPSRLRECSAPRQANGMPVFVLRTGARGLMPSDRSMSGEESHHLAATNSGCEGSSALRRHQVPT